MTYANFYKVTFWGTTPELWLAIPKHDRSNTLGEIEALAIKTVNEIAGRVQLASGSVRAIEYAAAFNSVIIEVEDGK